jgi:hypothetical protein
VLPVAILVGGLATRLRPAMEEERTMKGSFRIEGKDFWGWRGPGRNFGVEEAAVHQGIHNESDA